MQGSKDDLTHLVEKVLDMVEGEVLPRVDNAVKICFHEVRHYVDVLELLRRWRYQDVQYVYDLQAARGGLRQRMTSVHVFGSSEWLSFHT